MLAHGPLDRRLVVEVCDLIRKADDSPVIANTDEEMPSHVRVPECTDCPQKADLVLVIPGIEQLLKVEGVGFTAYFQCGIQERVEVGPDRRELGNGHAWTLAPASDT